MLILDFEQLLSFFFAKQQIFLFYFFEKTEIYRFWLAYKICLTFLNCLDCLIDLQSSLVRFFLILSNFEVFFLQNDISFYFLLGFVEHDFLKFTAKKPPIKYELLG